MPFKSTFYCTCSPLLHFHFNNISNLDEKRTFGNPANKFGHTANVKNGSNKYYLFFRLEQKQDLPGPEASGDSEVESANQRIRELELELAQTKLALVETECKNQVCT
jgi:hypothetical protein